MAVDQTNLVLAGDFKKFLFYLSRTFFITAEDNPLGRDLLTGAGLLSDELYGSIHKVPRTWH